MLGYRANWWRFLPSRWCDRRIARFLRLPAFSNSGKSTCGPSPFLGIPNTTSFRRAQLSLSYIAKHIGNWSLVLHRRRFLFRGPGRHLMPFPLIIAVLLGLVALGASSGGHSVPPSQRRSRLRTGPVSSKLLTYNLLRGTVQESPAQIAALIERKTGRSLDLPVVVLASMIASETGSGPRSAKAAVAWAARNEARATARTILQLLIPRGQLGAQGVAGRGYAATARPPNPIDLDVAQAVLENRIADVSEGSRYFDSPAAFEKLRGTEGYEPGRAQERVARMEARGYEPYYVPGVNPRYLRLWRKEGVAGSLAA